MEPASCISIILNYVIDYAKLYIFFATEQIKRMKITNIQVIFIKTMAFLNILLHLQLYSICFSLVAAMVGALPVATSQIAL